MYWLYEKKSLTKTIKAYNYEKVSNYFGNVYYDVGVNFI